MVARHSGIAVPSRLLERLLGEESEMSEEALRLNAEVLKVCFGSFI